MESSVFPIPSDKLREGVQLCLENAQRLYKDAYSLAAKNRYATPISLLILCSEEVAKGLWIAKKCKEEKSIVETEWRKWTRGRAHMRKLRYLKDELKEAIHIDVFEPFSEEQIQAIKEFGLYIGWKKNSEWSAFYEKLENETRISLFKMLLDIADKSIKLLESFMGRLA